MASPHPRPINDPLVVVISIAVVSVFALALAAVFALAGMALLGPAPQSASLPGDRMMVAGLGRAPEVAPPTSPLGRR